MESFGKILKFGSYSQQRIERMKTDLGFIMPIPFWQHCVDFYRNHAKRDPYIEELKMLDRFAASLQQSTSTQAIHELYTNDVAVAETYADMMQKRKALNPDARTPITTGEALTLANNYLLRVGKKLTHRLFTPFTENCPLTDQSFTSQNLLRANSNFQIRFLAPCKESKKSNDLFAILSPDPEAENAPGACDSLLCDKNFTAFVKSLHEITVGGILHALLREAHGFQINLDKIPHTEQPVSLSFLTDPLPKTYLVRIGNAKRDDMIRIAKAHGVLVSFLANATEGGTMTILQEQKELFQLDTSFLRTLYGQRPVIAKLQNESDGRLSATAQETKSYSVPFENIGCTMATCCPQNAFFSNAFFTALLAVLQGCLCGCDYSEQELSVCLRLPKSARSSVNNAYISMIIGLYRLQAELGMLSSEPCVMSDCAIHSPILTVFAHGNYSPVPSVLQQEGNAVYCFPIAAEENRLPNFEKLRKLLDELCELRKNGNLISAYAVCGESPSVALQKQTSGKLGCMIENEAWDKLSDTPISVVIESNIDLKDACRIGTVFQKESSEPSDISENND